MKTKKIIFFSVFFLSIFSSLCFGMISDEEREERFFLYKYPILGRDLVIASHNGDIKQVEKLLGLGADVNYQYPDGILDTSGHSTALHRAANQNYPEIALILLKKGANINARADVERTPLHYAVTGYFKKDNIESTNAIIRLLVKHGADIYALDKDKKSVYQTALEWDCDQSTLNLLQELISLKKAPDVSCSICLGDETEDLCTLPVCKHTFHRECIGEWLAKQATCPHCRQPVTLEEL